MTKIYLISPPQIEIDKFSESLKNALSSNRISVFQLRLKDYSQDIIKKYCKEIKKICDDYNCPLILNDFHEIALELGLAGVHVGVDDKKIDIIRKNSPQNFIIGASCYDSRHLAMQAGECGADYISFGAFFTSKTKQSRGKPSIELLQWAIEMLNLPIVGIGGITPDNCAELVKNKIDFLAVISCIWDREFEENKAIDELSNAIAKHSYENH